MLYGIKCVDLVSLPAGAGLIIVCLIITIDQDDVEPALTFEALSAQLDSKYQ